MEGRLDTWSWERLWQLRTVHALQECGILLLAFVPLDSAIQASSSARWQVIAGMFLAGLLMFIFGVALERRIHAR